MYAHLNECLLEKHGLQVGQNQHNLLAIKILKAESSLVILSAVCIFRQPIFILLDMRLFDVLWFLFSFIDQFLFHQSTKLILIKNNQVKSFFLLQASTFQSKLSIRLSFQNNLKQNTLVKIHIFNVPDIKTSTKELWFPARMVIS